MRRILFTGGGGAGSEAIYRQWNDRYNLYFGDADPQAISSAIPAARRLKLPFARANDFVSHVFRMAQELKLDLIVPGVDEELPPLAAQAARSPARILLPDLPFVESMLDKFEAARQIEAAGLTVPRTVPFEDARDLTFPIIVKPRSGRGSRGVSQIAGPAQLPAYLAMNNVTDSKTLIAQDCIEGQEYTVFIAADAAKRLAAVVPVKVLIKRGITIRAETDATPEIIDYAKRFQHHFQASGIYNIQCMLTRDRMVYPFEVNPRISTTFCLAIATGFDPVAAFLDGHSGPAFTPVRHWALQRSWFNGIEQL